MKPLDKEIRASEKSELVAKSYRLDRDLIEFIEREAKRLKTSESAVVRAMLRMAIKPRV